MLLLSWFQRFHLSRNDRDSVSSFLLLRNYLKFVGIRKKCDETRGHSLDRVHWSVRTCFAMIAQPGVDNRLRLLYIRTRRTMDVQIFLPSSSVVTSSSETSSDPTGRRIASSSLCCSSSVETVDSISIGTVRRVSAIRLCHCNLVSARDHIRLSNASSKGSISVGRDEKLSTMMKAYEVYLDHFRQVIQNCFH